MVELTQKEMRTTFGGGFIKVITTKGLNDGIKGNTEIFLFGIRIYHGKNAK
jgi:hypothetical protein